MKKTLGLLALVSVLSCGIFTPKTVLDLVLRAADIACLETGKGSAFGDSEAAADACGIARDPVLRDIVHNLVGQREAAKRAGFMWPADAGADAARDGGP